MIPSPWVALVVLLAVSRIVRLIGWDDLPPIVRARAWLTGEALSKGPYVDGDHYTYRRPTLAHFLGCPFCTGFWLSIGGYVAWLEEPRWTLYVAAPLALSTAVGLVAKNLDA